jgi:hypothetical protein
MELTAPAIPGAFGTVTADLIVSNFAFRHVGAL